MTNPLAEYDDQIAVLRAQIDPLRERLGQVSAERRAYADLLANDTDDLATLMSLRENSQVARAKVTELVRATTHSAIWEAVDWHAIEDDYSEGYLLGPHLAADRIPTDEEGIAALVASMRDFAERFCFPAPALVESTLTRYANVDACDMVFAGVLGSDPEARHSYVIYFSPDGTKAYLLDQYALGEIVAEGTLGQVLATTGRLATTPAR